MFSPLFLVGGYALNFKGKWSGNLTTSDGDSTSINMHIRTYDKKLQCFFKSESINQLVPPKVTIRTMRENVSYMLLIPSHYNPKFLSVNFGKANETGFVTSNGLTDDGKWNATLDYLDTKFINLHLQKVGKTSWYCFTFERSKPQIPRPLIGLIIASIITGGIFFIFKTLRKQKIE